MFCLSWQNYQKKLKFHQLASLCFLPPQVSGLWLFCNLSVGLGMYKIFKERRKTKAMCILHSETRSVESLHWDVHCPAAMTWAQVLMRPTLTTIRALFAPIWHLVRKYFLPQKVSQFIFPKVSDKQHIWNLEILVLWWKLHVQFKML